MLADYGDPVAVAQQVRRERSAQIAREYTCLAGVSRGRRLSWSGRPGVWYDAHLIDLGRRPDTVRPVPAADTVQDETAQPAKVTADDILAVFRARDNRPATVAEIAQACGATQSRCYHYLDQSDLFHKISVGRGNSANVYVPADASVDVGVEFTLSPALRQIYVTLAERGRMSIDELVAATGVRKSTVSRACSQRPDVFAGENVRVYGEPHVWRRLYVWLVDQS